MGLVAVGVVAALVLAACQVPLTAPADVGEIELVGVQTTADGWRYEYFRNRSYPCSISGYQTFVIGTRLPDDGIERRPLWVRMRGGGSGYFQSDGTPYPDDANMREEGLAHLVDPPQDNGLRNRLRTPGLVQEVLAHDAGFRGLSVSMCNRDTYGGSNNLDPGNPHPDEAGDPRRTNGLLATKAAIQFTMARYPTSDFFLHGGSAGAAGTYHVAYGLEQQGMPPTGIVADGGIRNDDWEAARIAQEVCTSRYGGPEWEAGFAPRIHADLRDPARQPHEMVASGAFTVPIVQVWSSGDPTMCGLQPMVCPLPTGPVVMGATDCKNEPLRAAIAATGPSGRSLSLGLCVARPGSPAGSCDRHVTTNSDLLNTDPAYPADYWTLIVDWVEDRLAEVVELSVGAARPCPWDETVDIRRTFLVAGEADAVALGANPSWLPPELVAGSERLFVFDSGGWQQLVPDAGFGPELAFAWTVLGACPDSEIGIVKHAAAGSTIDTWLPGGANWATLFSRAAGALTSGVPLSVEAALFHQGPSDASTLAGATGWPARTRRSSPRCATSPRCRTTCRCSTSPSAATGTRTT